MCKCRLRRTMYVMTPSATISLQHAAPHHDDALRRLSQLDSARTVTRPALMAVVDGRLVAAIALHSGRVVADPFAESEDAVRLLRLRADELRGDRPVRSRRHLPRLRAGRGLRPRTAV
jgi:hypothetical protein